MALQLKLISENPDVFDNFEVIEEQDNLKTGNSMYIKGPFIGCNQKNRNGRYYDFDDTRNEVQRYVNEMVNPKRAMEELNHPSSPDVDLERACHIVTELTESSEGFVGKAKVLSTPCGLIMKALINDGVSVGMSTRALGTIQEESGHNKVKNMHLVAIDAVADPSYPKAFVNGILESKSFVLDEKGSYEVLYDNFEKAISSLPRKDIDHYLREQVIKFINSL